MSLKGKLNPKDYVPDVIPLTDPGCGRPDWLYRNIQMINVTYETDYDSVAEMLPEPLEFATNPPLATVMVSNLIFSDLGEYGEAFLLFAVKYKGKDFLYAPNLFVTQEEPLIAGREIYGFPKKLADVGFKHQRNQFMGWVERPTGKRLFDVVVSPQTNLKQEDWKHTDALVIKQIPKEDGSGLDVCKLVGVDYHLTPVVGTDGIAEFFSGKGSISFYGMSADDPWYKAKVNKVVNAVYGRFNIRLPYGYEVHDYLK